jgi:hypothetical protein
MTFLLWCNRHLTDIFILELYTPHQTEPSSPLTHTNIEALGNEGPDKSIAGFIPSDLADQAVEY